MGNQNADTSRGQGQEKNVQNPGQNPNVKNPQQGQGQNQGRPSQQGFDKNRQQQNPGQSTGTQRTGAGNEADDEEISEKSEKEDLYGNRKNQGGNMDRTEKH